MSEHSSWRSPRRWPGYRYVQTNVCIQAPARRPRKIGMGIPDTTAHGAECQLRVELGGCRSAEPAAALGPRAVRLGGYQASDFIHW